MKERETPETDGAAWPVEMVHQESNYESWVRTDFARKLERERDEAREQCDANAKQLLETVNDRNSLGTQIDLLRDELQRIAARIGESGLGDNPYLSHISTYCQRAQKDIAVNYTPIEERDRACERLAVVSLQLEDCKAQRDELLAALEALRKAALPFPLEEIENISDGEDEMIPMRDVPAATTIYYDDGPTAADHSALSEAIAAARATIAAVKGSKL